MSEYEKSLRHINTPNVDTHPTMDTEGAIEAAGGGGGDKWRVRMRTVLPEMAVKNFVGFLRVFNFFWVVTICFLMGKGAKIRKQELRYLG